MGSIYDSYFCENPKCMFHVTVSLAVWTHTIKFYPPIEMQPLEVPRKISSYVATITRGKHLRKRKGKSDWFFCDACYEAIKMIT